MTICLLALLLWPANPVEDSTRTGVRAVPSIDIDRYLGTWYEIARFPNSFQESCAGEVTATYSLYDDGDVRVVNRCMKDNGEMTEAEGLARRSRPGEAPQEARSSRTMRRQTSLISK